MVWFGLRFSAAFSALALLWPVVEGPFTELYRNLGSALLPAASAAHLTLSVQPPAAAHAPGYSLLLSAHAQHALEALSMPIDLRSLAYLPTAALIALALATPLWQRGRAALCLLCALIVLQVFIAASIAAPLVLFFANPEPLPLLTLSPWAELILNVAYRSLVAPPGMTYAIPAAIWLGALYLWPRAPVQVIFDPR